MELIKLCKTCINYDPKIAYCHRHNNHCNTDQCCTAWGSLDISKLDFKPMLTVDIKSGAIINKEVKNSMATGKALKICSMIIDQKMSQSEVAKALKLSTGTISAYLSRCKDKGLIIALGKGQYQWVNQSDIQTQKSLDEPSVKPTKESVEQALIYQSKLLGQITAELRVQDKQIQELQSTVSTLEITAEELIKQIGQLQTDYDNLCTLVEKAMYGKISLYEQSMRIIEKLVSLKSA